MKVLLGMSGGVDSSVAAAILQKQGIEVIGATIKTWSSNECRDEKAKGCCSIKDVTDARLVAGRLGIPFYVLDLSDDFKETVIDNFVQTYLSGQTPNPCIRCNNSIKFGTFLQKAKELGCSHVATGHYARIAHDIETNVYAVQEGIDKSKDQSYVLFGLTQDQLAKTLFPVGEFSKKEIRAMAAELGMVTADKPDSMEICFIPKHYSDFIKQQGIELPGEGNFVDASGQVLGKHQGYHQYTIGQRKRIDVTDQTPYYVLKINPTTNEVVIGKKDELAQKRLHAIQMNWMKQPEEKDYTLKIRSKHIKAPARIIEWSTSEATIEFKDPVDAISPGQAAVIYDEDIVIGGGWIT